MPSTRAPATVALHIKRARLFFNDAIDRQIVRENPFKGVKAGSEKNASRQRFIDIAVIEDVIAACPSVEWKLVFALARYGGVRVPSEIRGLKWEHIHWDKDRITVLSPKTEHHEGGESRMVPLFPELSKLLLEAQGTAEVGEAYVLPKLRNVTNLSTTGAKIIGRSGHTPWGKLFQNLRSSRETELVKTYPIHVVSEWIGNTPEVAMDHYLQVVDAYFKAAAGKAAQNAAHSPAVTSNQEQSATVGNKQKSPISRAFAQACNVARVGKLPPRGVEPPYQTVARLKAVTLTKKPINELPPNRSLGILSVLTRYLQSYDIDNSITPVTEVMIFPLVNIRFH